ncbi:MAG: NUDIX domain-containing protein, partial [Candidatus Paceibacterota bacterium]
MKKEIKSIMRTKLLGDVPYVYRDLDSTDEIKDKKVKGVHAYCFCDNKLVIVYAEAKGTWTPAGGSVEEGESVEYAVEREVHEETNMKVLKQQIIGYQEIFEPNRTVIQTRSICVVEPYGPFISDPDGDITEIKLIDPKDYKQYFDWGEIGDHIMQRTLEI